MYISNIYIIIVIGITMYFLKNRLTIFQDEWVQGYTASLYKNYISIVNQDITIQ